METNIALSKMPEIFNLAGDYNGECFCDEIEHVEWMIEISLKEGALNGTRGLIGEKASEIVEEIIDIQDANNYIGKDYIKYLDVGLPAPPEYNDTGCDFTKDYRDNINKFIDRFLELFEDYPVVYMLPWGYSYIHFLISSVDFDGNILEFTDEYIQKMKDHMNSVITELFPNTDKVSVHIHK